MDPFTIISARVLHAERVAESARRRSWWGASSSESGRYGNLRPKLMAWLAALPARRQRHSEKKVAA
jgi:hypothetical protein